MYKIKSNFAQKYNTWYIYLPLCRSTTVADDWQGVNGNLSVGYGDE